jgi:hypothetical protein
MHILRISCCNGSLVNWTVVRLTTSKFENIIVSMPGFTSQSHIATDGQSVNKSLCRATSGAHDWIFITLEQIPSYFCAVCLLYMLLALASIVFLGYDAHRTRYHNLLSQILDFPFRRLLRFAGSRWKYSTPPPHGQSGLTLSCTASYILGADPQRTPLATPVYCCEKSARTCLSNRSIATAVSVTSRIVAIPLLLRAGIT